MVEPAALLVNGTVGTGKTSVADAAGQLLAQQGVPHAVIDLDWLRNAWPAPAGDPFQLELTLRILAGVATQMRAAGALRLLLAGVVESRADRERYQAAVGVPLIDARLQTEPEVIRQRLITRHQGDPTGLAWHLQRAPELEQILAGADVDDFVVETHLLSVGQVAQTLLRRVCWLR